MTLPKIVREICLFRDDESAKIIEARIEQTKAKATDIAWGIGIRRPHVSYLYCPHSSDDLEITPMKSATNWREALMQCNWGRHGRFTIVVRSND